MQLYTLITVRLLQADELARMSIIRTLEAHLNGCGIESAAWPDSHRETAATMHAYLAK
jgi:hypothetical protein